MAKKVVVVFDFDETLITKDTLLDFARFSTPFPLFLIKALRLMPWLFLFALHKINNQTAKEHLLTIFYKGLNIKDFNTVCNRYISRLNKIVNPDAMTALNNHLAQKHEIIIVSASIENWITPWARQYNIAVIATKLETKKDIITGRLSGKNCHGTEKVNRFLEVHPDRELYNLIVYGDGKSDKDMFKLADDYYEKRFS